MSFIRPEIQDAAWRWRESLVGASAVTLGIYLGFTGTLAAKIIAVALVVGGALLVVVGVQRARFRSDGQGPGVVTVDEGRLSYFGPVEGGQLAIADLTSVDLITTSGGSVWSFESEVAAPLLIPADASGSDALFDVFLALPGLDTATVLAAVESARPGRVMVWARSRDRVGLPSH